MEHKMNAKNLINLATIALLSASTLTACSKPKSYTTDFLYENDDIRTQVLADCKANKQTDDNCKNANEAEGKKTVENFHKKYNK